MTEFPNRKSIRLKSFDYSTEGMYFVTICTHERQILFGQIVNEKMKLNSVGKIIESIWQLLPNHFPIKLDTFQIMPNHIHMIIGQIFQRNYYEHIIRNEKELFKIRDYILTNPQRWERDRNNLD